MKLHPRIHSQKEAFFKRKYFKQWRRSCQNSSWPRRPGSRSARLWLAVWEIPSWLLHIPDLTKPSQIITGQAKRLSQAWPLAKYIEITDVFKPQALQSSIPNPLWPLRLFWCHQIAWPQQQGGNRKILGQNNCIRYHKIPEMGVSFFDLPAPGSLSQGYVSMGCFVQLGEITKMRGMFRSMFWKFRGMLRGCVSGYVSGIFRVCCAKVGLPSLS